MTKIELIDVAKSFRLGQSISGNAISAVSDLSITVEDGELLVLLGPSGCGKSTTLRLIAGLEVCDRGRILFDGQPPPRAPHKRNLAYVFQQPALFPHLSVSGNMAFGLGSNNQDAGVFDVLRRLFRPAPGSPSHSTPSHSTAVENDGGDANGRGIETRVRMAAKRLSIEHLLNRQPHQLSGGERQRVALGRAIVRNPAAFLLDEPLSSVDQWQRILLRTELRKIQKQTGTTTIYVTHDLAEAFAVADRMAVMNQGRLLQLGRPAEILNRPSSMFVAQFIGEYPVNWVKITSDAFGLISREREGKSIWLLTKSQSIQLANQPAIQPDPSDKSTSLSFSERQFTVPMVRPSDVELVRSAFVRGGFWLGIRPTNLSVVEIAGADMVSKLVDRRLTASGEILELELESAFGDWDLESGLLGTGLLGSGLLGSGSGESSRGWLVHRQRNAELADCKQANRERANREENRPGTGAKSPTPAVGETIGLKFDSTQLHFFDLQTGQNLRKDLDETK